MGQSQLEFEAFYAAAKDDCLLTVYACTGDLHRAEDLVAEAFARAWASWGRVAQHPAPRAWIVRTALNRGVSVWRRRRRELPLADLPGWEPAVDAVQQRAALWIGIDGKQVPGPTGFGYVTATTACLGN